MHLIREAGEYLLFDNETVNIYKLNEKQGMRLEKYTDAELDSLLQDVKEAVTKEEPRKERLECRRADRIVLVISQACNMGCKYCYAQEGSYGEKNKCLMDFDTLKKSIKKVLEIFPEGVSRIQYFGGEPLINFELMKVATPWIIEFFNKNNLESPALSIVTNGTLITPEVNEFFNQYNVNVTISIDGNKEINDINRIFKNSSDSTYDRIIENLKHINKNRNYILMFEMTVDRENYLQYKNNGNKLIDIEDLLKFKPDLFHIVPAIWPEGHKCSFGYDDNFELMKDYFVSVAKFSTDKFGTDTPFNVMKIADMARRIIKKDKKSVLCGAGIEQFSVDVNGDIYPCFAFIGQTEFRMGNIEEDDISQFRKISQICKANTYNTIDECKNCWANGLCSNCIGNSYLLHKRIDKPIAELCEVQKATLEQTIISCYKMVSKSEGDI